LLPTPFNRCRSDVKFLEYAAGGALAVCSDLEPYQKSIRSGENGFLFRDLSGLETALDRAVTDSEERIAIARTAARQIAEGRLERGHAHDRLGFYLSMSAALGFDRPPRHTPPARAAIPASGLGARAFEGAGYFALGAGETETRLNEGLALQQAARPAEARRCFSDAVDQAPGFYVAHMLLAGVEPDHPAALRALQTAERLNPRSCNVAFLIGAELQAAGDVDGAARAFERCREIAPSVGAAQSRLGEIAEAAGRTEQACRLYEEAALRNSYFALPVARLAMIALGHGQVEKAVGLLEQSLQNDSDLWLTNFLIGRGYVELKHFHQARVHLMRALDNAEDRGAVLAQLAKAEIGLGNVEAARAALEQLKGLATDKT
jgi:tetratricopeptide (TPR) repeat protein